MEFTMMPLKGIRFGGLLLAFSHVRLDRRLSFFQGDRADLPVLLRER